MMDPALKGLFSLLVVYNLLYRDKWGGIEKSHSNVEEINLR